MILRQNKMEIKSIMFNTFNWLKDLFLWPCFELIKTKGVCYA